MNKTIGIYTNRSKDSELAVTKRLIALLTESGFGVCLHKDIAFLSSEFKYFDESSDRLFDTLITVGGDGTILRIASYCAKNYISVLGVNLGTVGFLTEIELAQLEEIPALLAHGGFVLEHRSLLSVNINGNKHLALNDIVLSRNFSDRMIMLGVYVDDRLADKYYCDGYIVSTPTGSTAYSLSAGGCVLSPKVNAFSLLPINSHSLHSRPIIVSDSSEIKISLLASGKECAVVADGNQVGIIEPPCELSIEKAKEWLTFLRVKESNFYEKLLTKLNTWSVTLK